MEATCSKALVDFVLIETSYLLYLNPFVLMLSSFWSLSFQSQPQLHFHAEAWYTVL